MPGIAARLPMLFSEGVRAGRLTLNRFVSLSSTEAARLYGMHPRKGTIAIGADADIAIRDPELTRSVSVADQHDAMDYTPHEGRRVAGWPIGTDRRACASGVATICRFGCPRSSAR